MVLQPKALPRPYATTLTSGTTYMNSLNPLLPLPFPNPPRPGLTKVQTRSMDRTFSVSKPRPRTVNEEKNKSVRRKMLSSCIIIKRLIIACRFLEVRAN